MRRLTITAALVSFLIWILLIVDCYRYSVLSGGSQHHGCDISGTYEIAARNPDKLDGLPFSRKIGMPKRITISERNGAFEFLKLADSNNWEAWKVLTVPKEIRWVSASTAEYECDAGNAGTPVLPGIARQKIEGWIRVLPDGRLEVEEVYWEKGLMLFVFPFYDEVRKLYELTPSKIEAISENVVR